MVELGADPANLVKGLDAAKARLSAFAGQVATAGAALAGAGAATLAPLFSALSGAVERGQNAANLAAQLGTTAEKASALAYAFESVGINAQGLQGMVKGLSQKIDEAATSGGEAADLFLRLGVSWAELRRLPLEERFAKIADALSGFQDDAKRASLASKVLGDQGILAMRLFAGGAGELRARMREAADVGAVVTAEQAEQALRLSRAWTAATTAIKSTFLEIGVALFPTAESVAEFRQGLLAGLKAVRQWIADHRDMIAVAVKVGASLAGAGAALATAGAGLLALGAAATAAKAALGGASLVLTAGVGAVGLAYSVAAGVVSAAFAVMSAAAVAASATIHLAFADVTLGGLAVAAGVVAAGAALAGLGYVFVTQSNTARQFASTLLNDVVGAFASLKVRGAQALNGLRETAELAWGGIASALKRGDLAAAGEIAWAGLRVAWVEGVGFLRSVWQQFAEYFVRTWENVRTTFLNLFGEMVTGPKMLFAFLTARNDGERQRLLKEIEDERAAAAAEREGADRDAQRERQRNRIIALDNEKMRVERLRAELRRLVEAEREAAAAAEPLPPPRLAEDERLAEVGRMARGVFQAANYAQVFGGGAVKPEEKVAAAVESMMERQERTNSILERIEKKIDVPTFG